jgi:hypothetical protein
MKPKLKKYNTKYLSFGLKILMLREKRGHSVYCMKILAACSMKPDKLKRRHKTRKGTEFFHIKLNKFIE